MLVVIDGAKTMKEYIQKVENSLKNGDRNPGQLKDETDLTYPQIFAAIAELVKLEKIEHYWINDPTPVLTYRLKRVPFSIFK